MSLIPFLGVSRWKLRHQVAVLRAERKRLEDQVEALTAVAEEVVDTCAFAEDMAWSYRDWVIATLLPMAQAALELLKEK